MTAHLSGDNERAAPALERMWELCLKHGMRAFTANGLQTLCRRVQRASATSPKKGLPFALECIDRSPRYANAHFSAGKAYFLMKRYDEARAMYLRAIEDGQYHRPAIRGRRRGSAVESAVRDREYLCRTGRLLRARSEWFERGLANRPAIQPLRLNYANSLEKLGRLPEAEAMFRSIYSDFGDEQSIVCLVNYLLRHQQEREAVDVVDRHYGEVAPQAAVSMLLAAAVVTQRSNWGDGERYLLEAQRISPGSPEVRAALEALRRNRQTSSAFESVQSLFAEQRYDEVIMRASEALAEFPFEPRFSYYAALACANLGRKDEALVYLDGITDPSAGEAPPPAERDASTRIRTQRRGPRGARARVDAECGKRGCTADERCAAGKRSAHRRSGRGAACGAAPSRRNARPSNWRACIYAKGGWKTQSA